jgi:hypothetical protein
MYNGKLFFLYIYIKLPFKQKDRKLFFIIKVNIQVRSFFFQKKFKIKLKSY